MSSIPRPPSRVTRRRCLTTLAASLAAPWVGTRAAQRLRLGQSIALSGPLGELGQAAHDGARACFAAVNAAGGMAGQSIELVVKDDGYDVKRAVAHVEAFLNDSSIFGLFNCMGTPMVEASLPMLRRTDMPYFAPFTGALLARPADMRNIFNVRASYPDETEELVQHLTTIGIKRIAVVYQNNAFGKEIFTAAQAALARRSLTPVGTATVENTGIDAQAAVTTIIGASPEAVVLGLAGQPTIDVIKAFRVARKGLPLYALSVMGSASTLRALGDDAAGVTVSQVVPLPTQSTLPVVRDYLSDWKALGTSLAPSHLALEGYINARVMVEVLRRAGRNPTRAAFVDAAWAMTRHDLGGFQVGFQGPGTNASRYVELTMVSRDGRFIR